MKEKKERQELDEFIGDGMTDINVVEEETKDHLDFPPGTPVDRCGRRMFPVQEHEGIDESRPEMVTQLLDKNESPMIIRKYQSFGWPLFVAIICDQSLADLDETVMHYIKSCNPISLNDIQMFRDWCGALSTTIVEHYNDKKFGCVEGVAVISYWDKCLCSSLFGDHMTHGQCRLELFQLINMMTNM